MKPWNDDDEFYPLGSSEKVENSGEDDRHREEMLRWCQESENDTTAVKVLKMLYRDGFISAHKWSAIFWKYESEKIEAIIQNRKPKETVLSPETCARLDKLEEELDLHLNKKNVK